jgi:hypothetical protein
VKIVEEGDKEAYTEEDDEEGEEEGKVKWKNAETRRLCCCKSVRDGLFPSLNQSMKMVHQ